MRELIKHIKRWNCWRKHNGNGRLHKLLVLLKIIESPTMGLVWIEEDGLILDFRPAVEKAQAEYDRMRQQYITEARQQSGGEEQ